MAMVVTTPKRVLVADDDESIRHLLWTLVRREDLQVDCAADGEEAIEWLERYDYSVILLDLMMPRKNGFEVIDYIRDHPGPARKPIVLVITAYADQRFREVDPEIVAGVVRKPFDIAEIGSMVRLCVNHADEDLRRVIASEDSGLRQALTRFVEPPESSVDGETKLSYSPASSLTARTTPPRTT